MTLRILQKPPHLTEEETGLFAEVRRHAKATHLEGSRALERRGEWLQSQV